MGKQYLRCNSPLGLFSWRALFLESISTRGNYVGDQSSKKQFSSGAISMGILSRGNYRWGNCPGAIIFGQSSRGQFSEGEIFLRGNCPGESFPQGYFSGGNNPGGAIIQSAIFRGVIPRGATVRLPKLTSFSKARKYLKSFPFW